MPSDRPRRPRSPRRRRNRSGPPSKSEPPGRRRGQRRPEPPAREAAGSQPRPKSAAAATRDPFLGRTLGGYEIRERLATGPTCITFQANQPAMGRLITLDILTEQAAADPATVANFYETARTAAQVHHPNIVSIYDVTSAEGLHFRAMERVEGRSLGELLRSRQRFPSDDAVRVVLGVAEALRAANAKGMPALSLSPDHVVLTPRGEVKVLLPPLAPAGAAPHDDRYVLQAAGVLLYAMVSAGRVADLQAALEPGSPVADQLPPVKQAAIGTRRDVAETIERLLGRDADHRYPHAEAAMADLRRLLQVDEKRERRTRTATERARERRKRRRVGLVLAIALPVLALLGVSAYLLHTSGRRRRLRDDFRGLLMRETELRKAAMELQRQFYRAPRPSTADIARCIAPYQEARAFYGAFEAEHPGEEFTVERPQETQRGVESASSRIAVLDAHISKFRSRAGHWIALHAARAELEATDQAFEAAVAAKTKHGGTIDQDRWRKRYADLYLKYARAFPSIAQRAENRRRNLARRVRTAQMSIDARQLRRDFDEKYGPQQDFRGYLAAWDSFRAKYQAIGYLREQADGIYEREANLARRAANGLYHELAVKAGKLAAKGDHQGARAIYQRVIQSFGFEDIVRRAREALAKLPRE